MQPVLIFDLETDGLLNAVTKIHLLVTRDLQTGHAEVYRGDTILEGIKALQAFQGLLVGHNAIKYDHPVLAKLHPDLPIPIDKVQDSMVLSRLIHPDLWDTDNKLKVAGKMAGALMNSHSLKAWGIRLGLHKGDYAGDPAIVDEKVRRETMWATWNQAMEDYCLQDTAVTEKLWVAMNKSILYPGVRSVELEHTVARILARQERQGFLFDIKQAEKLYVKLAVIREQLRTALTKTFPPWWTAGAIVEPLKTISYRKNPMQAGTCAGAPYQKVVQYVFNPSSRTHIANRLKARHGWVPTEFTDGGEPKIDETVLATMPWPEARELEEYFLVDKRIGAIAEGKQAWLKQVTSDNRVHGSVNPNGAVTGRMTHSNPNMGQIPSATSLYGKECRALFIVPPGKKLVGCDADALELRDLAGFMAPYDGGAYIKTILEGKKELGTDMHSVNCRGIGLQPKTKYFGEETGRDIAKTWFL